MPLNPPLAVPSIEVESALLSVLLSAESAREGAVAVLNALAPVVDDLPSAIAVRDRDGLTLHVLAEQGPAHPWPARLEPQFALGSQPGVDPGTSAYVVPLRANGRVVGALLLGEAARAARMMRADDAERAIATTAAVMHVLVARTEGELRRRALALRSIDSVLDGMAHQMANPLTGASAIAQLLVDELQDEGQRAAVRQIRQEMARAFTVLSDLLDFQRDTQAQDGILDLGAVLDRVLRFRGYAIREQGITVEAEPAATYLPVRADSSSLEHALLLALRHAELRSSGTMNRRIAVRIAEQPDGDLAVEITDSGPGDPPDVAPAYFDLPFRSEHPARETRGVPPDLGLVASIMRGCGGRLDIRGSKADGTTLSLVLPRAYTNPANTSRTNQ